MTDPATSPEHWKVSVAFDEFTLLDKIWSKCLLSDNGRPRLARLPSNKVRPFVRECPASAVLARWLALARWRLTSGVSKQNPSPGTRILFFYVVSHSSPNKPARHFERQLVAFATFVQWNIFSCLWWKTESAALFVGHLKPRSKPAATAYNLTISTICRSVMIYCIWTCRSNNSNCYNWCVLWHNAIFKRQSC